MRFDEFFQTLADGHAPRPWQAALAEDATCSSGTIRIPTGFGKTLGVIAAWLWHRVGHQDDTWPRRLVWCLPMRVLVEQTAAEVRGALERLGLLWDGTGSHAGKVGVHVLMGASEPGAWQQHPEHCAVLIGTQDMLLSRALNRGYAAPRARWPMDFGLLNQDCLWVMDEVQLMDVGLATSAQLQAFRDDDAASRHCPRPSRTWWMSATLQTDWLSQSPDTGRLVAALGNTAIPPAERIGPLWTDVEKPCECISVKSTKALVVAIRERHLAAGRGAAGPTLVVLNTVDHACEVWEALVSDQALTGTDRRLIHSRFRPHERAQWASAFLNRAACAPGTDRIIVATQVIEAGVDVSAGLLITALAPWASLVQRFGRCARWGGRGQVVVVEFEGQKSQKPYDDAPVAAARAALDRLLTTADGVAPLALTAFEEANPDLLAGLYPFAPTHLLLRHELDELFDTTPDLSGADVDISRFIRSGDERDLQVFWATVDGPRPPSDLRAGRDALCAVPFLLAREWLCRPKAEVLAPGKRAWVWDYEDGAWRPAERRDLYPGQTVLVDAACGGYALDRGFAIKSKEPVATLPTGTPDPDTLADAAQDDETLSAYPWKTIATHGRETAAIACAIATALTPDLAPLFDLAGRWHDAGKVHPAFRGSITGGPPGATRDDLAKAPAAAWAPPHQLYRMPDGARRPGLRHELASTLALFGVLQRHAPDHAALLGPWRELFAATGHTAPATTDDPAPLAAPTQLETEVLALSADEFDLLAWLVCTHHGKLRLAWHASKADQAANDRRLRIRGIRHGETLPAVTLASADGKAVLLPATRLDLSPAAAGLSPSTGAGWTDRGLGLLGRHGPFTLAWLEALLRAADQRASQLDTADPLLTPHPETKDVRPGLEASDHRLAAPAGSGTTASGAAADTALGCQEHGLRGGAGGRADAGGGDRAPSQSTRFLHTALGILSDTDLAPHLARRVGAMELRIAQGEFGTRALDEDLIRDLHLGICSDLVPDIAGQWRRVDVRVGSHEPPRANEVPLRMRDYSLDLNARLSAISAPTDERLPEFLAFAEGRLLSIHPFVDFNGRVTRLLLRELRRRLHLPNFDATPEPGAETHAYLAALRAADQSNWQPLLAIWKQRFAQETRA